MSKRTYQPKKRRRARVHGFRKRMSTPTGRNVIKRRMKKGRKKLTVWFRMLKKINRLKKKKDFQRVYQSRFRFNLPEMAIQWRPLTGQNFPSRFGIIVSNKISKSAVKKNRAKRLLREAIRILMKENKTPPGLDFVINAKKPILDATYHGLYKTLENFFSGQKTIRR